MTEPEAPLKKQLKLIDVFAISTGATLSAGFFLLPGIAAQTAGPALVLAYLIAALPMIPAMFSVVELATAMPRAGGVYYFLDRSLGPLMGMIGGLGTWLAMILKVAFALVGMGAYLRIFFGDLPEVPVAIVLAVALGALNLMSAKKSGRFQVFLVVGLLTAISGLIFGGLPKIRLEYFSGFFDAGYDAILATSGLVYISYVGITKVASLSEEVKDPERVLPRAVFLSLGTALVIYGLGTATIVGLLPMDELQGSHTPVANAAAVAFGETGRYVMTIAALMAFVSVANAGMMSASRYPLAMGRDHLMPRRFLKLGRFGTPTAAIALTVAVAVVVLLIFDVAKIAKLASAFQLLMFALVCFAVIVWRESGIDSYDPGFKSPLYPWMQLFGIVSAIVLIVEMGWLPSFFSLGLILASVLSFRFYAQQNVSREGAIYHLFERLGRRRDHGLDRELRGILKEKGLRDQDPFDEIVARSEVLDPEDASSFESLVEVAAQFLGNQVGVDSAEISKKLLQGTRVGATPVSKGVALPHVRLPGIAHAEMVIVRSRVGVEIVPDLPTEARQSEHTAYALFFLVSPVEDPAQHLRILAQLAGRVDEDDFSREWFKAKNFQQLKEVLLRDENFLTLKIRADTKTAELAGHTVREVPLPQSTLIAIVRRSGHTLVPRGGTILEAGDRITIIGESDSIHELEKRYHEEYVG